MVARGDARDISADNFESAASIDFVRSNVRSKLRSRVRGVEQPIRAPSGVRDHDRDSVPLGRHMRAPGIPMSSRTRQLLGCVRKPFAGSREAIVILGSS